MTVLQECYIFSQNATEQKIAGAIIEIIFNGETANHRAGASVMSDEDDDEMWIEEVEKVAIQFKRKSSRGLLFLLQCVPAA